MQQLGENLIAYLNDQLSPEEKVKVESWIRQSSDNRSYFEEIRSIYKASSIIEDFIPDVQSAWEIVDKKISESKVVQLEQPYWKQAYRIAAAVVFAIGMGVLGYYQFNQSTIEFTTNAGQIRYVELSDGTYIAMNENTKLSFSESFGRKDRVVELSGQAYFEVAKNPNKPFVIQGQDVKVEVLGTAFDMLTKQGKAIVNVKEGVVEMSDKDEVIELQANERGELNQDNLSEINGLDTSKMQWREEELVFRSSPLSEVVSKLSKHFNVTIELEDKISECLITSSFKNQSLDEILNVLQTIANIKSNKAGKTIKLTGPGC